MSPDPRGRAGDRIVTALSQWLARHIGEGELRGRIQEIGTGELSPAQAQAVRELLAQLEPGATRGRGDVEMLARETVEILALGDELPG